MDCNSTTLPYSETGHFTSIVLDYLEQDQKLKPFYRHPVSLAGVADAIEARKNSSFKHRQLLVSELKKQYELVNSSDQVKQNIQLLLLENTFTVCTAHQPAIFTGTLYFVYKILHTIRLADHFRTSFPGNNFVPVFYMGCEDADLDELGKIYLEGEKIKWSTDQSGAVGRMSTKGLDQILNRIEGELSVQEFGPSLIKILRESYAEGSDIQTATFKLIDTLFQKYGLVVLIPDNANLKKIMLDVFEDDLFRQIPSAIVQSTTAELEKHYKVQANPREINLFYLDEQRRDRIEKSGDDEWKVLGQELRFTKEELKSHLHQHCEKFSPNVILRGLLQEMVLPNIAFVGGGGELAYWMEYLDLFDHYNVPFPVLILRNSFLVIESKWQQKIEKLEFETSYIFRSEDELLKEIVRRDSHQKLTLENEISHASAYYDQLKTLAGNVDDTLVQHVSALQSKALRPLVELEKKLIRAEKRKFEAEQRQIHALKSKLFPLEGLQERIDNFMPYYAKWGDEFIDKIYEHSLALEQKFTVLIEEVPGNADAVSS